MAHTDEAVVAEEAAITVNRVTKFFGGPQGVKALDDISFSIRDQEFVSLLGPSGCGKSTMLRIIAGLISSEGDGVSLLGTTVTSPSEDVGVVFQTSNLLPWRTVVANIRLGVEASGRQPDDFDTRVKEMIETLGLQGFESSYPHELSGGMQQRVAIGQALARNPRVLLMDEPFGALDALTRDRMNSELLRIWQAHRKTVLLVTHSIVEAVFLSDRILVMSTRPGRIVEEMSIDLPRPRDPKDTRKSPEFGEYVVQLGEIMGAWGSGSSEGRD
jgi:NitT/TauT family transport system ATP-binding protein